MPVDDITRERLRRTMDACRGRLAKLKTVPQRTETLTVPHPLTGKAITFRLAEDGTVLPREPHNASYMRGWNQRPNHGRTAR